MNQLFHSLRWVFNKTNSSTRRGSAGRRFALLELEYLEDRLAPATFTWKATADGKDHYWNDPANWEEERGQTPTQIGLDKKLCGARKSFLEA